MILAAFELGIGIMAYMPLAGGLLTGKGTVPAGSRTATVEGEYHRKLDKDAVFGEFSKLCREMGERAAELNLDDAVMKKLDSILDINKRRPLKKGPIPEAFAW